MSMHLSDSNKETPIKVPDLERGELHLQVSFDHFVYISSDDDFHCQDLRLQLPLARRERQWFKLRSLIKKGSERLGPIANDISRTRRFLFNNPVTLHMFDW